MRHTEEMVLTKIRRLSRRELRFWVRQGWVRPAVGEAGPVFDELDIARLRLLCDLRKEMALPTTAMPVVLNLIDQLYQTRRDLRTLLRALDDQPEDVRSTLAARLRLSDTNDAAEDSD
ncbi:MerR family transcriptional regulator [Puniceibacterium sp. HSS470]|nr:MerR family transcriptional regulator [Puniceibacterium sp. HSS470]